MKKLFFLFALCLISSHSFAQLEVTATSDDFKRVHIGSGYYYVQSRDSNFYALDVMRTTNQFDSPVSFVLGLTKESALTTTKQLSEWLTKQEPETMVFKDAAGNQYTGKIVDLKKLWLSFSHTYVIYIYPKNRAGSFAIDETTINFLLEQLQK